MIDKFINRLNNKLMVHGIKAEQIANDFKAGVDLYAERFISIDALRWEMENVANLIEAECVRDKITTTPVKKFLFVEDGSVDVDNLIEELEMKNPDIKVVVYRTGTRRPEIFDVIDNGE